MKRVFCATLGCDKNLVDSETLLGRFALKGVEAVNDPEEADIWILNSCGFIEASRIDSEDTLQTLIEMKEEQILVVFGCWSQEHDTMIKERYPEVDIIAGVGQFDKVVTACLGEKETSTAVDAFVMAGEVPPAKVIIQPPTQVKYSGMIGRPLLTPGHMAFVKIGEGCNCHCTFCRIPMIRGKQQSRSIAEIEREVQSLVQRGVTEIQLVSQNTSDFGRETGENLLDLVRVLNNVDGLKMMRLLYMYAGLVTVKDLLGILEYEKVAPYLDLPIQHASPRILKAMKRPGGETSSPKFYQSLRQEHPDLVLRSTALLGFPGEEEEDVSLLEDFLAEVQFDHLGTYRYSPEKGTAAADLPNRIPDEVILDREARIMDLQTDISQARQKTRLGKVFDVVVDKIITYEEADEEGLPELVDSFDEAIWSENNQYQIFSNLRDLGKTLAVGRSRHYGYDLDGVVLLDADGLKVGDWVSSRFQAVTPYDTWASVIKTVSR